jgi:hypothetical protein
MNSGMTMTRIDNGDMERVEMLLQHAKDAQVTLPPGLAGRVMADAERIQPARSFRPGRRLLEALGGWPALGGLAVASSVGFWIGISPPEGMVDPAILLQDSAGDGYDDTAELSGFGWDLDEG